LTANELRFYTDGLAHLLESWFRGRNPFKKGNFAGIVSFQCGLYIKMNNIDLSSMLPAPRAAQYFCLPDDVMVVRFCICAELCKQLQQLFHTPHLPNTDRLKDQNDPFTDGKVCISGHGV